MIDARPGMLGLLLLCIGLCIGVLSQVTHAQTYSRTETTTYHDDLSKWVLGQTAKHTVNGILTAETAYTSNAQPSQHKAFGKVVQTLTYHADGTVATTMDGNGSTTTLSNWKRGIPQTIKYPATPESPNGATELAVVNDAGWITSVTNENNQTTKYQYDEMGRLTLVDYPDGDSVNWTNTTISFTPVAANEFGLPAGHWKQVSQTGSGRKEVYYDALWRPVLERQYDASSAAMTEDTLSELVKRYDAQGRMIFQSYPVRGITDINR